jgi:hypothetical protein
MLADTIKQLILLEDYEMGKLIKNLQKVIFISILLVIFFFPKITHAAGFNGPYIHGYVFGENDNLTAIIIWKTENQEEYGFKVEKEWNGEKKIAAIYNPVMLGINPTPDGFYLDQAIKEGETFSYIITWFDRAGNEGELGKIDLKVKSGLIDFSLESLKNKKGRVAFEWGKIENAQSYQIYRDGKLLGETDKLTYIDKEPINGMHQYEIKAFEKKANVGDIISKVLAVNQEKEIASLNIALKTESRSNLHNYLIGFILAIIFSIGLIFSFKKHA